jgi:hypothetical protein
MAMVIQSKSPLLMREAGFVQVELSTRPAAVPWQPLLSQQPPWLPSQPQPR